jgi:hypothetical protein
MADYPEEASAPYEHDEETPCALCGQLMRADDLDRCDACGRYVCVTYGDCMQIYCHCGRNYCWADACLAAGKRCCKEDEEVSVSGGW